MSERNNIRHLARLVVEAKTPIAIGSGEKSIETDARIIKDVNGLPYIPATAIAGVLRHALDETGKKDHFKLWGYQIPKKKKDGLGSRIVFSNANILDSDGTPVDGILIKGKSNFLKEFDLLPIRQHAKINDKGATVDKGKFDEEVVYQGTRFCFEIEMITEEESEEDDHYFDTLLNEFYSKSIRFGGGTRSGFGELAIIACKKRTLNLTNEKDLEAYLNKSSSLSENRFWENANIHQKGNPRESDFIDETIPIKPLDFFLFASGSKNSKASMNPVTESIIDWTDGIGKFKKEYILIPATSVKGALAHRIAYHYNRIEKVYADDEKLQREEHVGKCNLAVRALFGEEGDGPQGNAQRGNVIFSDIIEVPKGKIKYLNHVAIDRFTGGGIEGALFTEKVNDEHGREFNLRIIIDRRSVNIIAGNKKKSVYKALDSAINDLCNGMLPLGGGVNRGNGVFEGKREDNEFFTNNIEKKS